MPKKTVSTSVHAPSRDPVEAVIAKAQANARATEIPAEAVDALRRVLLHNDAQPRNAPTRVSMAVAAQMLRDHYGVQISSNSKGSFDALCRRVLGRVSWGTP